jgi:hypothetical protein
MTEKVIARAFKIFTPSQEKPFANRTRVALSATHSDNDLGGSSHAKDYMPVGDGECIAAVMPSRACTNSLMSSNCVEDRRTRGGDTNWPPWIFPNRLPPGHPDQTFVESSARHICCNR